MPRDAGTPVRNPCGKVWSSQKYREHGEQAAGLEHSKLTQGKTLMSPLDNLTVTGALGRWLGG